MDIQTQQSYYYANRPSVGSGVQNNRLHGNNRNRSRSPGMIGAAGSRHAARRRASLVSNTALPSHFTALPGMPEEEPQVRVARRRVVDNSDLRQCALLQTRLKEIKSYPELISQRNHIIKWQIKSNFTIFLFCVLTGSYSINSGSF
ncbi:hypothetical protein LOTGIDRAFT_162274 [Lottia gigantea]|uniref:Uncharacterized protein n=1 Tax=Lottia gigantea TaxID=225164 RepID=V4A7S1_LOTGI|nr:hypothetical protein LOTGIDRAFT_162274 [Lottia gigantea]ESO92792.1 hypothetical protein LOTGIDRAFT_162274 [Lottia gigantea]